MTAFTSSPAMVALMPTASSLPVLLAILPAGAGADVCDCRCVLLVMDIWGICRKFPFWGSFLKIVCRKINSLRHRKNSKIEICDRSRKGAKSMEAGHNTLKAAG
jgi:Transmembrane secretion effector